MNQSFPNRKKTNGDVAKAILLSELIDWLCGFDR